MMKGKIAQASLLVLVLALASTIAALAQTKPNFTGTWKQNNAKSTVRPGPTYQYVNKIDHQDPNLTVTTVFSGGNRPDSSYTRTYTTDGKPTVSKDREGDEFTTTVKWEGDTLVFETVEKERGANISSRETWNLSEDGKTLAKTLHSSGPQGERDQKYVLEKQ